jgi:hypothetical protein
MRSIIVLGEGPLTDTLQARLANYRLILEAEGHTGNF